MCERNQSENVDETDRMDDAVDPRVQIELERLNTATDDINKLEVDLDVARATFRELLCESTMTIEALSKKLGSCIERSRPYYDARFKAKEALRDAQKAAIRFERANGQHAAAKEMVYLAEEGLTMPGRCFDHAWQEMLNHATERVNESEHERALSEAEHRHMTALYHSAEHHVQRLQSDLKRAIAKSRPYYEMKAQFNQALEKQKTRVGVLEQSVGEAKMTYAEALRNLEKISDEIHQTRRYEHSSNQQSDSNSLIKSTNETSTTTTSSESSLTGSPDSTDSMSDEYLRLPEKMSPNAPCPVPSKIERDSSSEFMGLTHIKNLSTEPRKYIKRERPRSIATPSVNNSQTSKTGGSTPQFHFCKSTPNIQEINNPTDDITKLKHDNYNNHNDNSHNNCEKKDKKFESNDEWTEISLNNSPETIYYNDEIYSDDEDQIPYKPLPSELSPDNNHTFTTGQIINEKKYLINQQSLTTMSQNNEEIVVSKRKIEMTRSPSNKSRGKLDSSLANWITRSSAANSIESNSGVSGHSSRRQSLDMLWNTGTGERMKELLSHGMMMLNISSLTERRSSEPKISETDNLDNIKEKENGLMQKINDKIEVKGKKVPSPLEKTMCYLNADEETSDSESLASVEMLTEDQISSLMMEPDVNQVCQEVLGTPLVEVCPLLQQLQEQQ